MLLPGCSSTQNIALQEHRRHRRTALAASKLPSLTAWESVLPKGRVRDRRVLPRDLMKTGPGFFGWKGTTKLSNSPVDHIAGFRFGSATTEPPKNMFWRAPYNEPPSELRHYSGPKMEAQNCPDCLRPQHCHERATNGRTHKARPRLAVANPVEGVGEPNVVQEVHAGWI